MRRDIVWSILKAGAAVTGRKLYETFIGTSESSTRPSPPFVHSTPPEPDNKSTQSSPKRESRGARLFRNLLGSPNRTKRHSKKNVPTLGD